MFMVLLMMFGVLVGITVAGANYEAPTLTEYIREMDAIKQWGISRAAFIPAKGLTIPPPVRPYSAGATPDTT